MLGELWALSPPACGPVGWGRRSLGVAGAVGRVPSRGPAGGQVGQGPVAPFEAGAVTSHHRII